MKKLISLLLIAALLCLCGCSSQQSPKSFEVLESPDFGTNKRIEPPTEPQNGVAVPTYNPDDYQNVRSYSEANAVTASTIPQTLDKILEEIDTTGLLVSGSAFGDRESVEDGLYFGTKTQFRIDHVFYGNASHGDIIMVNEGYILKTNGEETYVYSIGDHYTRLKNEKYVLLFLRPAIREGYAPAYYPLEVPEDCNEWSEEYLESLLDYYRGDPETFKYKEDTIIPTSDGRSALIQAPEWPRREISNEALIEEMQDNLFIYLATEMKVKIWPTTHINYTGEFPGISGTGTAQWQLPEAQAKGYIY